MLVEEQKDTFLLYICDKTEVDPNKIWSRFDMIF